MPLLFRNLSPPCGRKGFFSLRGSGGFFLSFSAATTLCDHMCLLFRLRTQTCPKPYRPHWQSNSRKRNIRSSCSTCSDIYFTCYIKCILSMFFYCLCFIPQLPEILLTYLTSTFSLLCPVHEQTHTHTIWVLFWEIHITHKFSSIEMVLISEESELL